MAIEYKDYYEILGVTRAASDDEIRVAFRRMARIYHPDKTGNNQEAEDQFKEINEAYEVLGDPDKRSRYDDFSGAWESGLIGDEAWKNFTRKSQFATGDQKDHFEFDGPGFSEFFGELFGRKGEPRGGSQKKDQPPKESSGPIDGRGDDLETDLWVTLDEVVTGAVRTVAMKRASKCTTCFGMGQYNAHPCDTCKGAGNLVKNETCKVKVPKGIKEGAFLRVPGRGEAGIANGPAGDLYLKIHYIAHPDFHLERGQLVHDLELAPWEAVLGASISVPTLSGPTTIKVPAGTQNGAKLRLKGRGLPSADSSTGDLILNVRIQVPENAPARERQLWEELAKESVFHPRQN
ncbi:MAG: DnaJ C-terminal domain-containing protein [Limisphaerales bacterium]